MGPKVPISNWDSNYLERGVVPLYVQLARILRTQINSGEYKPDDALPTEDALSKGFGVSRITVREALRILASEGLIVRHSGKGTFVAKRSGLGAPFWAAVTIQDAFHDGRETRRRYLGRRVLRASHGVAQSLQIPPDTRVLEVQKLMYIDETPLAHVTLTIPYALGRRIPEKRLAEKPLILLLSEVCGIPLGEADQWTAASLADRRIGDALGLTPGDPILVIERIFYDAEGRPIEVAVNRYRTDRYRHHLRLRQTLGASERQRSLIGALGHSPA